MGKMTIQYSAASDRGQRSSNQDNLCVGGMTADVDACYERSGSLESDCLQVLCVCDGIGGESMGDVAAMLALESVMAAASAPGAMKNGLRQLALDAAEAAQEKVCSFFLKMGRAGGCTLTLAAVCGREFVLLNIGDSPCFLWRKADGQLAELSIRHNLEWFKRRMNVEPAAWDSNYLMRFIGKQGCSVSMMADLAEGTLEEGDRMLLCSDGVSNVLSMEDLSSRLAAGADASVLVKEAAAAPGADNCTAIVFTIRENNG